jgi:predicted SnoaL-like aldol condensation-catalyzing enzyme
MMDKPMDQYPVGLAMDVTYPQFEVSLTLLSTTQIKFQIKKGPYARTEVVEINVVPLGNGIFAVSWQERDGATVTNVQDFDRRRVYSCATLHDGHFLRMVGTFEVTRAPEASLDRLPERNKALVLSAMTSLFQQRDASAVDRLYTPDYVQHNPQIPQGRDALRLLVAGLPANVFYEPGLMVAEGDFVAIHGRITGWAEVPQVVVDLFRIQDGKLAEHWDVLQDEMTASAAAGGTAMFDPTERSALQGNA